ncbi:MAG: hypothetical protein HY094_04270 [Candidatus Melainabacteria bacterium]|nr:hypothetical protein [Candidatus Melainabacteria bacterium]
MVRPITIATAFLSALPLGLGCTGKDPDRNKELSAKPQIERKIITKEPIKDGSIELAELYKALPSLPLLQVVYKKDTKEVVVALLDPEHIYGALEKQNISKSAQKFIVSALASRASKDVDFIYSRQKDGLLTIITPEDLRNEPPIKLTESFPESIKNLSLYRYGFPIFIESREIDIAHDPQATKVLAQTAAIRKYIDKDGISKDGVQLKFVSLENGNVKIETRILPIDVPLFVVDYFQSNPPVPFTLNFIDVGNHFDPNKNEVVGKLRIVTD